MAHPATRPALSYPQLERGGGGAGVRAFCGMATERACVRT